MQQVKSRHDRTDIVSFLVAPFRTLVIMAALCNETCQLLSLACLALQLSAGVLLAAGQSTNGTAGASSQTAKADTFIQPKTLAELLALPPDQLEKVDIARIDLLCAEGLPGAEDWTLKDASKRWMNGRGM